MARKLTHTPGPWRVGSNPSAIVHGPAPASDSTDITSIAYGGQLVAESVFVAADATLIAAAPEMLAALENLAKRIDSASGAGILTAGQHDDLLTLITKARGE
ncbi:MAG: hypothetical protein GY813_19380 [Halieaceae bacterium]|nr:hypothetical protein [Halieaceae bacterium]